MLDQIIILLQQIFIMFLLMATGYAIYKLGMLTNDATRQLSNLLAKVIAPIIMFCSFQRAFDPALGKTLLIVLLFGFGTFIIGIVLSAALYPQKKFANYANRRMCTTYSNNGFMALPLLSAMFGSLGVFYGSMHIVASTVLTWAYSIPQLKSEPDGKPKWKIILLNPGTLAFLAGSVLFLSPVKLPPAIFEALNHLGALNTPLAMLILGCFLAQTDLRACFRDISLLKISAVRLLVIPLCVVALLLFAPLDETARVALLIGSAAPTAISVATFAQMYDSDYLYCTRVVAMSTLLSIVTMPLIIALYTVLRSFF